MVNVRVDAGGSSELVLAKHDARVMFWTIVR